MGHDKGSNGVGLQTLRLSARVQVLALPFPICGTLNKLLNVSGSCVLSCEMGSLIVPTS